MRKITSEAVEALMNGYDYKCGNTKVENHAMYLHGNKIAWRVKGMLFISNCDYFTSVTKERLNGLPNVTIQQIKGRMVSKRQKVEWQSYQNKKINRITNN